MKDLEKEPVYSFSNYRTYLRSRLGDEGQRTGMRLKASKKIGCHSTYLSQVLNEKIHLSLEHAEGLNSFLQHTRDEADFFILLVQRERAGTEALKDRLSKMMRNLLDKRKVISNRLERVSQVSQDDQNRFYSDWIYTAIHVLVSIPKFQKSEDLAATLGLSLQTVNQAVDFLLKIGVVVLKAQKIMPGPQHIHIGSEASQISNHHSNWRFHAIRSIAASRADDLHFSSVISLSEKGAEQLQQKIISSLEADMKFIKDSKEEVAFVYNFDFYRLSP